MDLDRYDRQHVRIELYRDSTRAYTISSSYSNSGSYTWSNVSNSIGSGTRYRIKVSSYYDGAVYAFSDYFTISSRYSGTITVSSPNPRTP